MPLTKHEASLAGPENAEEIRATMLKYLKPIVGPVILDCPCGRALEICQREDGRWILGHYDHDCSYLIHVGGSIAGGVEAEEANENALGKIILQLIKAKQEGTFEWNPLKAKEKVM